MANVFYELGFILILAGIFAFLLKLIRQPLIPAYILAGLFVGPVLGLVKDYNMVSTLSEIGIAFLLFMVGLEININRIKDVGVVSNLGGIIRSLIMFFAGFFVALGMGVFSKLEAFYIGVILAFSSTMVVVKLLSDKRELDTLHGRISVGILLIEDVMAVLVLSVLITLNDFSILNMALSLVKSAGAVILAVVLGRYFLPRIFKTAAKSQELLFLLAVGICFAFAMGLNYFGFSLAIGAFIAGVMLGSLPYHIEIISRITPLRDFFSIIFFVSLGLQLITGSFQYILIPLFIFFVLTVIFKPIITMFLCSFFGYRRRTSFLTAIHLAQISEFVLIIASQGFVLGHISQNILTLTVLLAIGTIVISSYLIKYDEMLYAKAASFLPFLDRFADADKDLNYVPDAKNDILLCGYNRIGYSILNTAKKMKKKMLVVDFNPEIIRSLIKEKIPCVYGDIGNVALLDRLDLKNTKMVISTVPTVRDNLLLIQKTRENNKKAVIFVTANQIDEAMQLYDNGADYVILPHFLGGERVALLLEEFKGNVKKLMETKLRHIEELKRRHALGHEHPLHY